MWEAQQKSRCVQSGPVHAYHMLHSLIRHLDSSLVSTEVLASTLASWGSRGEGAWPCMLSLSRRLWLDAQPDALAALHHPFIRALSCGSLPRLAHPGMRLQLSVTVTALTKHSALGIQQRAQPCPHLPGALLDVVSRGCLLP